MKTIVLKHTPSVTFLSWIAELAGVPTKEVAVEFDTLASSYMNTIQQGRFRIVHYSKQGSRLNKDEIAGFALVTLPGCCGIVVSTGSYVCEKFRNRGIGTVLNKMRQRIAFRWGYGMMIGTTIESNKPERKILDKNAWSCVANFRNPRTGNVVYCHVKELSAQEDLPLGFELPVFAVVAKKKD